jgi:hypothetical protein
MSTTLQTVSETCLGGRALPSGLAAMWKAQEAGDPFLADALGATLLTSLEPLEDGYGEGIAEGNPDILANVRAHQQAFKRLGVIAEDDDSGFLAYDFQTGPVDNPPVVQLDSEGQYSWKGANLGEALYRVAEDKGEPEEAKEWLAAHGLAVGELGVLGSTTQFLPSIKDWHSGLYYEFKGNPRSKIADSAKPAEPNDPETWLLRPGKEVQKALLTLLNLPGDVTPAEQWVDCDGDGRVTTIWLKKRNETIQMGIHGVRFGMPENEVTALIGTPEKTGKGWVKFAFGQQRLRLGIKNGVVESLSLFIEG